MTDAEKAKFTAAVAGLASFYRVKLSRMAPGIYWDILREHDLKPLQEAMRCHIKDPEHGRWMAPPTPADIIRHLPACGMDTDAAWDAAMKSRLWDDDITIEVSMAVYNAFPFGMWKRGDKAGARMAFKDAWPAARAKYGDQVEVSLGHHKASRAAADRCRVRGDAT